MPDWKCTTCGAINLEGQRVCEGCGSETRGPHRVGDVIRDTYPDLPRSGMHVVRSQPLPSERPCTLEQSKAANQVLQDVLERRIKADEGRKRLAVIFQMPELVEEV
jgi:hypothetical protein